MFVLTILPFDEMWNAFRRIIKPNCAMIIFGREPFSSHLRMSNLKEFKYDLIWKKSKSCELIPEKLGELPTA